MLAADIAMCLELKERGLTDEQVIDTVNAGFAAQRRFFDVLLRAIDLLPMSYKIAERWNVGDHAKRVADGSITYDSFEVGEGKVEYRISHCMYVEVFDHYGIRGLCKIFCMTDERAYAGLALVVVDAAHEEHCPPVVREALCEPAHVALRGGRPGRGGKDAHTEPRDSFVRFIMSHEWKT